MNNNKMERFNGEVRDREKVMSGLKQFLLPNIALIEKLKKVALIIYYPHFNFHKMNTSILYCYTEKCYFSDNSSIFSDSYTSLFFSAILTKGSLVLVGFFHTDGSFGSDYSDGGAIVTDEK